MKKYLKFIVAGLIALVFIGTFVFLWIQSRPQTVEYEEFTPKVMDLRKTTVVTGKIEPRNEVNVKPQISGIIAEIMKEAGQMVQAGEIIARVKVIPDMGQLSNAQSRVRLAEINLKQATANYERQKQLFDKELISADEFEKIRQAYGQAREERQAASDNLEVVRDGVSSGNANTSSTLIRSTISGLILDVPVKVGNTVILSNTFNDGTTIASVANMNDMIFRGNVDETEIGKIREGMPIKLTVGALGSRTFDAVLEYVSPKGEEKNGAIQFEIKAAVSLPDTSFVRAGYSANAEIVLERAENVLTIPESTVEFHGDTAFVQVVKQEKPKQIFEKRQIKTGLSDGIKIEVKEGLTEKDKIRGAAISKEANNNNEAKP